MPRRNKSVITTPRRVSWPSINVRIRGASSARCSLKMPVAVTSETASRTALRNVLYTSASTSVGSPTWT